ncbi:MAG: Hsp20/alpha crystallin family protein [Steroidobacteraceae bacterium]
MTHRQRQAWMWAEACELISQAERLQQQFFRPGHQAAWEPPIDLIQDGSQLQLIIALPGVALEHITLRLDDNGLFVEAIRPCSLNIGTATIHRLEIPYGRFARRVKLPPGTYELKEKFLHNGCLSLHLIKHD